MSSADDQRITYLGRTNFRESRRVFGIRQADRRGHMYIIGKTGTGKSTLLENLIRQDLEAGRGLAVLDPHGSLIEGVEALMPERRQAEGIRLDPAEPEPLGFNPLEQVLPSARPLVASGMLETFKKLWSDSWGPRLEHILRNALLTLLDQPEATLADLLRLLDDRVYRRHAAERTTSKAVRDFWLREYEGYPSRFRMEAIAPVQNKVGAFLASPILARVLGQAKSAFDLRTVMDSGQILLVNLAKGRIGEDTATLLGSLLVSRIGMAALSRADVPEAERRDFTLYLDEFHSFTTLSLATMLSELRKYRVSLVLAHQYLAQLDERIRDAILGNVGTLIVFRIGGLDAEILETEFEPEIKAIDFVNLPNHHIYVKLMIGGVISRPFSAETLAPEDARRS